jgi:hypothetical protein
MPRVSTARVSCPRPAHAASRVKLDGTYGTPGHRRRRYTCSPRRGKPHVFTELLPREESWHESCEHCERRVERRQGPKAPRRYQFVARGIAEALAAVGAGATYMQASRVARARARRFRFDPETGEVRESAHGQLVADWVELFATVVFDLHRPTAWPAEGSLVLDQPALPHPGRGSGRRRDPRRTSRLRRLLRGRIPRRQAAAMAYGGLLQRPSGPLERVLGRALVSPQGSSATPTRESCRRSRSVGPERNCISASGTYSMRSSACWPRRPESGPARGSPSFATAPRERSLDPASGYRSCGRLAPSRTTASIAGLRSMAPRSRSSSLGGRLLLAGRRRCP